MIKEKFKRIIVGILAFVMVLIPVVNSFAASATQSWIGGYYYTTSGGAWGQHSRKWVDNDEVFCVEPMVVMQEGEGYTEAEVSEMMSNSLKKEIELIHHYGYTLSSKSDRDYVYTQTAIWECLGYSVKVGSSSNSDDLRGDYDSWKSGIENQISNILAVPSWNESFVKFNGKTIELDGEGKIEGAEVINNGGNKVTIENGNIKIIVKNSESTLIKFRKLPENFENYNELSLIYKKSGSQTVAKVGLNIDPPEFSVTIVSEEGGTKPTKARIRKENPQGESIAGAVFEMSYNKDFSQKWEYTTDKDGYTPYDTWNNIGEKVYIREKSVPAPYVKTDEIKTFIVGQEETTIIFINSTEDIPNIPDKFKGGKFFAIDLLKIDKDTGEEIELNDSFTLKELSPYSCQKYDYVTNKRFRFLEKMVFEGSFDKTFTVKDAITEYPLVGKHLRTEDGKIFYGKKIDGKLHYNRYDLPLMAISPKIYQEEKMDGGGRIHIWATEDRYDNNSLEWAKRDWEKNKSYIENVRKEPHPEIDFETYYIREKVAPLGYKKNPKIYSINLKKRENKIFTFDVGLGAKLDLLQYRIENEKLKNKLKVIKKAEQLVGKEEEIIKLRDKEYKVQKPKFEKTFLANAKFELKKGEETIKEFTTKEEVFETEINPNEKYSLIEKTTPNGFLPLKEEIVFELKDKDLEEYNNIKKEFDDFIKKEEEKYKQNHNIIDYYKIKDRNEEEINSFIKRLKEKYNALGQRTNDNILEKEILNERKKVSIKLNKTFEKGAKDEEKWAVFGLFAKEDNGIYRKDELIEVLEFTKDEEKSFSTDYYSKYYIKELDTSKKYIIDDKKYDVDFTSTDKTEIKIDVNNKKRAEAKLKLAKVGEVLENYVDEKVKVKDKEYSVKKPTFKKSFIEGAKFDIKQNGKVIKTVTSKNDFVEIDLEPGKYQVVEKESPVGYIKTDKVYDVDLTLKENEDVVIKELEVENEREKVKLNLTKSFEKGKFKQETFAVFGLFTKEKQNGLEKDTLIEVLEFDKENSTKEFKNTIKGKYYIKELDTSSGYRIDKEIHDVTLISEKSESKTILNKLKRGAIQIVKVDKDNKEIKLEGVEFKLLANNEDRTEIETKTTNKDGIVTFENLEVGEYILVETKTKDGYILDDTEKIVRVKDDEKITVETIENEKTTVLIHKVGIDDETKQLEDCEFEIIEVEDEEKVETEDKTASTLEKFQTVLNIFKKEKIEENKENILD